MDEMDKTIPPLRAQAFSGMDDMTMPGRRVRKPDGRFAVGDLIMNRYKVLAELGQGGMGVVYRCLDETAGIEVALKALPPELSHNTLEMEDIKENFQLVAKLIHQNIAVSKNLEQDSSNGNYYLIMECCEGEDLRRWIRRKRKDGSLTLEEVIPVIQQVADALDYAHSEEVIHRDIKPGNIMISSAGKVKVLDFGLAAQIHTSMTRVSMAYHGTSGTGPYMAPEQWRGRAQGAPADQYALAVMTYEMLAGHLPFESPDPAVLKQAVLDEDPEEISSVPQTVRNAVKRAMSKDPSARFASCSDFVAALGGKTIKKVQRSGKSRFPVWAAVVIIAVLLGISGSGYYLFEQNRKKALNTEQNANSIRNDISIRIAEMRTGNFDRAQQFGVHIDSANAQFSKAEEYFNSKDFQKALDSYRKCGKELEWLKTNAPVREEARKKLLDIQKQLEIAEKISSDTAHSEAYDKFANRLEAIRELFSMANFSAAMEQLRSSEKALKLFIEICIKANKTKIKADMDAKNYDTALISTYKLKKLFPKDQELSTFEKNIKIAMEQVKTAKHISQLEQFYEDEAWDKVELLSQKILDEYPDNQKVIEIRNAAKIENITNDSQLQQYILHLCGKADSSNFSRRQIQKAMNEFDFRDFKTYVPSRCFLADALELGINFTATSYLIENKKLSATELSGWNKKSTLHAALEAPAPKLKAIRCLIDNGVNVNAADSEGNTPAHIVKSVAIAQFLLQQGAELNRKNNYQKTPADLAPFAVAKYFADNGGAVSNEETLIRKAAAAGDLKFIRSSIETVRKLRDIMLDAARSGNLELIKFLEAENFSFDLKDQNGENVLHRAALNKKISAAVFEYIKKKTIFTDKTKDNENNTPFHKAAQSGNCDILRYLIKAKRFNDVPNLSGDTPLVRAVKNNHTEAIRVLLAAGANPNVKTTGYSTCLGIAVSNQNVEAVKLLCERGADVNKFIIPDHSTALHLCAKEFHDTKILETLIQHKANVNAQDQRGWTPLHRLVAAKQKNILPRVRLLLKHGADPNIRSKASHGWPTPLFRAAYDNNIELAILLCEFGADPNLKDANGMTPLRLAKDPKLRSQLFRKTLKGNLSQITVTSADELAAAVAAAAENSVISLAPGVYKLNNSLRILKTLTLTGTDKSKTQLEFIKGSVVVRGGTREKRVTLENISIKSTSPSTPIEAYSGHILLKNCDVRGGKYQTITLYQSTLTVLPQCNIYGKVDLSTSSYLDAEKMNVSVSRSDMHAVYIASNSEAVIRNSVLSGTSEYGAFRLSDGKAKLFNCHIKNSGSKGAALEVSTGTVFAEGTVFEGNEAAYSLGSDLSILNSCTLKSRSGYGFKYTRSNNLRVYNCTYQGPRRLFDSQSKGLIRHARIAADHSLEGEKTQPAPAPAPEAPKTNITPDSGRHQKFQGKWIYIGTVTTNTRVTRNGSILKEDQQPPKREMTTLDLMPDNTFSYVRSGRRESFSGAWSYLNDVLFLTHRDNASGISSRLKITPVWLSDNAVELKYDLASYRSMLQNRMNALSNYKASYSVANVYYKPDGSLVQVINMTTNSNNVRFTVTITMESSRKVFVRKR